MDPLRFLVDVMNIGSPEDCMFLGDAIKPTIIVFTVIGFVVGAFLGTTEERIGTRAIASTACMGVSGVLVGFMLTMVPTYMFTDFLRSLMVAPFFTPAVVWALWGASVYFRE